MMRTENNFEKNVSRTPTAGTVTYSRTAADDMLEKARQNGSV